MIGNIVTIDFHGTQLVGFENERGAFIALKPVVEGMGLDWSAQYRRVTRDPILMEGVAMMAMPLGQEQVCLSLDMIHGWLFTIDSERVKPELRDRVLVFKRDCYRVLARTFARAAPAAEQPAPGPVDTVQWEPARKLVAESRHLFGELAGRQLWFKLGLPTVPAMYGGPAQLPLFTYEAQPRP